MKTFILILTMFNLVWGQMRIDPNKDIELRPVEYFGKKLYNYDIACWVASDSLAALKPDKTTFDSFFAKEDNGSWKIGFGKMNEENTAYMVAYECLFNAATNECKVIYYKDKLEDKSFYYFSKKAKDEALKLTNLKYPPYNYAVIPLDENHFYLYLYPGQIDYNSYRFGADFKFTYSIPDKKITDSKPLHNALLNMPYVKKDDDKFESTYHNAVLTDIPVETDILYVLSRKFKALHYVITQKLVFIINDKGKIMSYPKDKIKELVH